MDLLEGLKDDLIGTCKLTGNRGKFVKSHIIPAALTLPERKDKGLVQLGLYHRPSRKWTSWYDNSLVTKEGEDVLSSIDNRAIFELRKHKLVWSGWGPVVALPESKDPTSVRVINDVNSKALRFFFLSILWRAASTSRLEFKEISLGRADLNLIRDMIISRSILPLNFFPIALVQISSIGPWHNRSPFGEEYFAKEQWGSEFPDTPFFRFYMDGLIVHIHRETTKDFDEISDAGIFVGDKNLLIVSCVSYETSRQCLDMDHVMKKLKGDGPCL